MMSGDPRRSSTTLRKSSKLQPRILRELTEELSRVFELFHRKLALSGLLTQVGQRFQRVLSHPRVGECENDLGTAARDVLISLETQTHGFDRGVRSLGVHP